MRAERLHSPCQLQHTDLCRYNWNQSWFWCQKSLPHTGKLDSTLVQVPKNSKRRSRGSQLQSIPSFFMVRQRSLIITGVRFWKGYLRQMDFHLPSPYFFTPSLIHSLSCMVHFCKEQGSSFREELHGKEPAANSFLARSSLLGRARNGREGRQVLAAAHRCAADVQQLPSYGSGELLVAPAWDLLLGNGCQVCVPHLNKTLNLSSTRGIWQSWLRAIKTEAPEAHWQCLQAGQAQPQPVLPWGLQGHCPTARPAPST